MQYPVFCDETTITGDGTEEHVLTVIGGGGGSPGGSLGDIQFNNPLGTFDGSDDFQFFPEGSAGGEFLIFSSSDGNNCQLFIGTDLSTTQTTGTFIAQVDGGNLAIIMNDQTNAPLGILILNEDVAGIGIKIKDTSLGGLLLQALGAGNTIQLIGDGATQTDITIGHSAQSDQVSVNGDNVALTAKGNVFIQTEEGGGSILLAGDAAATAIKLGRATDLCGFFNVTPVGQQPAPTLLSDVIAILTAFGLCAA